MLEVPEGEAANADRIICRGGPPCPPKPLARTSCTLKTEMSTLVPGIVFPVTVACSPVFTLPLETSIVGGNKNGPYFRLSVVDGTGIQSGGAIKFSVSTVVRQNYLEFLGSRKWLNSKRPAVSAFVC